MPNYYRRGSTDLDAAAGAAAPLALVAHNPAALADYVINTNGGAPVDVDAANLVVTFTVPASGRVQVTLAALTRQDTAGSISWSLREGTAEVANARVHIYDGAANARMTYIALLTGLTPGVVLTYKWAAMNNQPNNFHIFAGGGATGVGPAVMKVEAV